ncbi:hypothetical protein B4N89_20585 [Embleya scabrispora]|uniref:Scaffolding protein n=1 Tax=Embleya scabrispora TaxID=159449 RepID=A0A1T3P1N5_9ACTN|nr:hypothetical protein [Embleya scabrispora]OPC83013.1 hypothetical protein B4N89_20585 [Embleya scabrispora]
METPDLVMPVHPGTGLTAVYVSPRTGRAFWPIKGGSEDAGDAGESAGDGDADASTDAGAEAEAAGSAADSAKGDAKPTPKDVTKSSAGKDEDPAATIARLEKELKGARGEAAKERVSAKEAAATEARAAMVQELGKALGLIKDEKAPPPDPAKLMAEIERAQAAHRDTAVELAVYKGAAAHGADPDALTDSRAFLNTLAKLDPAADGFTKAVGKAIEQAVKDNPKLSAAGQAPARASGEFSGGTGDEPPSGTRSIDDIRAERRKRRAG